MKKALCLIIVASLIMVMISNLEPSLALNESITNWATEYDRILSEGYTDYDDGYIDKDAISDSKTVFALAYINDDNIPELLVAPQGDMAAIISIDGNFPKMIRRGLYYSQYSENGSFGYYERNNYISAFMSYDDYETEFWENIYANSRLGSPIFFKRDCYSYYPEENTYFWSTGSFNDVNYLSEDEFYELLSTNIDLENYKPFEVYRNTAKNRKQLLSVQEDTPEPESNIYNLCDETYSFENYEDDISAGHCFGMSMTSAGYYQGLLDRTSIIGGKLSQSLYSFSETAKIKKPICHYQLIQGSYEQAAMVAGGTYDLHGHFDTDADWNDVVNYVKNHDYDNRGALQVGYWGGNTGDVFDGGHAVNFLYYKEVNGQPRLYIYDNNDPDEENYLYKDAFGYVREAPYPTFECIDGIDLVDVSKYFSKVAAYDASRCIYSKKRKIKILGDDVIVSQMKGTPDSGGLLMYELPDYIEKVTIVPNSDDASFTYMNEQYSFGKIDDNTYGELYLSITDNNDSSFSITNNQGTIDIVHGNQYRILSSNSKTVALVKAKNASKISIPPTVKISGEKYRVVRICANAFQGGKIRTVTIGKNIKSIDKKTFAKSKVTKVVVKTRKLTKSKVKGSLKASKVKTIKVKAGSKKTNKKYVKKYKKIFTKKNIGKKVAVK